MATQSEEQVHRWLAAQRSMDILELDAKIELDLPDKNVPVEFATVSSSGSVALLTKKAETLCIFPFSVPYKSIPVPIPIPVPVYHHQVKGLKFITKGKKELVAVAYPDGTIKLWDQIQQSVHKVHEQEEMVGHKVNMCTIDESTIVLCANECLDSMRNVFMLNIDDRPWTTVNSLRMKNRWKSLDHICYLKTSGESSLVFCGSSEPEVFEVVAIDLVNGKVKWVVGSEEFGERFNPSGIQADNSGHVFIADKGYNRVYMLLGEQGTLQETILTSQDGIYSPECLAIHGQHLYLIHYDNKERKEKLVLSKYSSQFANILPQSGQFNQYP